MTYLVVWSLRRRDSGTFEVSSLDEVPEKLAEVVEYLSIEVGYEPLDDADCGFYDFGIDAVYEVTPVTIDPSGLLAQMLPFVEEKIHAQEEVRRLRREVEERAQLALLSKKYG